MSNDAIQPQSIGGIKQLAKNIKKTENIIHAKALDKASIAAGFNNFKHARRSLVSGVGGVTNHVPFLIHISCYWYDKEERKSGCEVITCRLPRPLDDICKKSRLHKVKELWGSRRVCEDHILFDDRKSSQRQAQRMLKRALSAIQFMEATNLIPFFTSDIRNHSYPDLPHSDHVTEWFHPALKAFILADEPYDNSVASDSKQFDRLAWAKDNGWLLSRSDWHGLYNPGHCPLFLAAPFKNRILFEEIINALKSLPNNFEDRDWSGLSLSGSEVFNSPLSMTEKDKKRSVPNFWKYSVRTKHSVPYSHKYGSPRRPNSIMPIEVHKRVGTVLKNVILSPVIDYADSQRLGRVRSTLEDWMEIEVRPSRLPGREFFDVYYGERDQTHPSFKNCQSIENIPSILEDLEVQLKRYYNDSSPLRTLLKDLRFVG